MTMIMIWKKKTQTIVFDREKHDIQFENINKNNHMTSISHKLTDSINATNVTKIQIGLLVEDNQQLETREKKNERKITTITEI